MNQHSKIYFGVPALIFMAGILFSCVNDLETIERVTYDSKAPDEVTQDVQIFHTDSGFAQVHLQAELIETLKFPKHITKLKDGLKIDFYGTEGEISSTLTALYGEIDHAAGLMFVRDSVRFYNYEKEQTLETEELYYKEGDTSVYTNKYVVIKKNGKGIIGHGTGITTSHSFRFYKITDPVYTLDDL